MEVAAVPVTFKYVLFTPPAKLVVPRLVTVSEPKVDVAAKRLVEEAVVLKKLVLVALVDVEFKAVKFCKVVEPESNRLDSEVSPPVTVKVPVRLAAEEMV